VDKIAESTATGFFIILSALLLFIFVSLKSVGHKVEQSLLSYYSFFFSNLDLRSPNRAIKTEQKDPSGPFQIENSRINRLADRNV
jgi:hypothetical protein